jgi:hypothetical protein
VFDEEVALSAWVDFRFCFHFPCCKEIYRLAHFCLMQLFIWMRVMVSCFPLPVEFSIIKCNDAFKRLQEMNVTMRLSVHKK